MIVVSVVLLGILLEGTGLDGGITRSKHLFVRTTCVRNHAYETRESDNVSPQTQSSGSQQRHAKTSTLKIKITSE
jgi:hypothetical protein